MRVKDVLKNKGAAVVTVHPDATCRALLALLAEHNIGAVVVSNDGVTVGGIVSERDIVRALAEGGPEALEQPVSSCMTRDVQFAAPGDTLDALLGRMTDRRIRHLPVCQNDRLVGLVSIGDLVKWKISEVEAEAEGLKSYIATG